MLKQAQRLEMIMGRMERFKYLPLVMACLVVGCGQNDGKSGNRLSAMKTSKNIARASVTCGVPSLDVGGDDPAFSTAFRKGSTAHEQTSANFAAAYARACAKGILKDKGLVEPKAKGGFKITIINAPEANAASIYPADTQPNEAILEYFFLAGDGRTNVPTVAELEEAIYCAAHGATPEEQESSGRCLAD